MSVPAKVTIISGYYNREDYVDESIQSLVDQDYDDFDIVIFDDASTDQTFERLRQFERKYHNIKVIKHPKNIGFVQGLIDTIAEIRSEYIAIHGSGDISLPNRIKEQVEYLDLHPNVGVVASRSRPKNGVENQKYSTISEITTKDLQTANPLNHGASMFRRRTYLEVGGYRSYFTFAQDYDLWLRMSLVSEIHILPRLHYIRESPHNTVSRNINKILIQLLLSSYSAGLINMRKENGFDFIDRFGPHASLFYNPVKRTNSINKLMMLQGLQDKDDNMMYLMEVSKSINSSFKNIIFLQFTKFVFSLPLLRRFISFIIRIRLNGRDVKDFRSISK